MSHGQHPGHLPILARSPHSQSVHRRRRCASTQARAGTPRWDSVGSAARQRRAIKVGGNGRGVKGLRCGELYGWSTLYMDSSCAALLLPQSLIPFETAADRRTTASSPVPALGCCIPRLRAIVSSASERRDRGVETAGRRFFTPARRPHAPCTRRRTR